MIPSPVRLPLTCSEHMVEDTRARARARCARSRRVNLSMRQAVWVSARRPLVTVHLPAGATDRTYCGELVYAGELPLGERITGRQAVELVGQPCPVCFPRRPR